MNCRYRLAWSSTAAALIRRPFRPDQVSGLWQYTQRSGQPAVNTTNRVPGPSTPVDRSQECTEPVISAGPAGACTGSAVATVMVRPTRGRCG